MELRQCRECEETVDNARAFCPGCGSPLVAEAYRKKPSRFEQCPHTQDLDESMLLAILGDMELDLSKPADTGETLVKNMQTKRTQPSPGRIKSARNKVNWLMLAGLALALLSSFGLFAASVLIHAIWLRRGLDFLLTISVPA